MQSIKKAAVVVPALAVMLSLAACGGSNSPSTSTASAPASASAPTPASTPAVDQSQVFTAVRDTDSGLDGVPAQVSFAAGSSTGTLSINSVDYATLTPDAANDGMMTVSGTPTLGVTLGVIPPQQPVLFPGIIEACEPDATGAPNPAAGNMPLKSKVVAIAGLPIKNVALLLGTTFPTYYENCLRDGLPTPQAQHSLLTIDGNAILSVTDVRNSPNPVVTPPPASLLETQEAGNNGDWLIPFLYITPDGQRHIALVQHGTVAGGHDHNFVGVWLDQ